MYYCIHKSQKNLVSGLQSCEEYAVLDLLRQSIRASHFWDFASYSMFPESRPWRVIMGLSALFSLQVSFTTFKHCPWA